MRKPKINVPLIRKVLRHVKTEPRRLNMRNWAMNVGPEDSVDNPPCGTAACMAGRAILLSSNPKKWPSTIERIEFGSYDPSERARKLLGLDIDEAYDAHSVSTEHVIGYKKQLAKIKCVLNKVFIDRGLKTRV